MIKAKVRKKNIYRVGVFTFCIFTLFCIDFFKIGESGFKVFSEGAPMPDMQFDYTSEQLLNVIGSLGYEGRRFYLRFLCVDFAFIISFALAQTEILKIIMGKVLLGSKWRYLSCLSFLRGFFDAAENILIIIILTNYPCELAGTARAAGIATSLKFLALGLWVVSGLILFVVRKSGIKDNKKIFVQ